MRKQTALSSFLVSEKTPDAGKHSKTRAEKEDQMILKGSIDAVGRIHTREAIRKYCLRKLVKLPALTREGVFFSDQVGRRPVGAPVTSSYRERGGYRKRG